jgi:lipid-A-disaccharide synthase
MPGSRKQELQRHLPIMIDYATEHSDQSFILPMAQGVTQQSLEALSPKPLTSNIELVDDSWTALNQAKLGIITSGTATLEAMLFDVPQVVIYKTSWVTYKIAQLLVKIKWASLVNIIANKEVVKELLQYDATMENLENTLEDLVNNTDRVNAQYKAITASLHTTDNPIHEMVDDLISKLDS